MGRVKRYTLIGVKDLPKVQPGSTRERLRHLLLQREWTIRELMAESGCTENNIRTAFHSWHLGETTPKNSAPIPAEGVVGGLYRHLCAGCGGSYQTDDPDSTLCATCAGWCSCGLGLREERFGGRCVFCQEKMNVREEKS